ncbi:DUF4153 domain-containing protein [Roseospira goensis]|uniref:DUF4153 domain-containing protein n=1 Tax=Roseospira goensis TaxID=391922 RepID=A0A7W6RXC1_9PROT|nr:DUF4153 domain-containing protein [Roseospira goensis]MBB4284470.1 hypothetical protein [Roseospira goensis]
MTSIPVSVLMSALANQPSTWLSAARGNPVAAACAVLGTLLLTVWNLADPAGALGHAVTIGLMTSGIGFFAALAVNWGLRRGGAWAQPARMVWAVIIILVAGGTLFAIPDHPEARLWPYVFWQAGAVLMALYFALRPPKDAPVESAQIVGWYGGLRVLVSAGTTWLLATLLGGGVTVALFAVDEILGLSVSQDVFEEVWILAYGLVWPMSFLVGAQQALPEESHERPPVPERTPRWVGVTVGWALIPLALLYLAILYVYLIQVVLGVAVDWGSVAGLNAAYLAFGVATHVASLPLAVDGHRLARVYRRVFPWSVPLPLLALAWALWLRLAQYGMTEPRALLTLVVVWLVILLMVWLWRGATAGPATPVGLLAVLLVLGGNGPWGAPEVSMVSQERALRELLEQHGMLEDGRAVPADGAVPVEDQRRIAHLLSYFHDRGTNYRLAEMFSDEVITAEMRLEALEIDIMATRAPASLTVRPESDQAVVTVRGFDSLLPLSVHGQGASTALSDGADATDGADSAGAATPVVALDGPAVTVAPPQSETVLRLDLSPVVERAFATTEARADGLVRLPADSLAVEATADGWRARLVPDGITVLHRGAVADVEVVSVTGVVLLAAPDRPAAAE